MRKVRADGSSLCIAKSAADGAADGSHAFTFDKVFPPSFGQDQVFVEVSEFVQSALDGYNVCLFSYGQTGSGKTHTMQGYGKGDMRGIIPRSIEKIGIYREYMKEKGWAYTMEVRGGAGLTHADPPCRR
jgi:kinesin family protein C1